MMNLLLVISNIAQFPFPWQLPKQHKQAGQNKLVPMLLHTTLAKDNLWQFIKNFSFILEVSNNHEFPY